MEITFVCGDWTHYSGGNRAIALYAQKLPQRGHEVFGVCPSPRKPSLREQMRSLVAGNGWLPSSPFNPTYFDDANIPHQILDHQAPVTDTDVPDAAYARATRYTWENATEQFEKALYKAFERSNSSWRIAPSRIETDQKFLLRI